MRRYPWKKLIVLLALLSILAGCQNAPAKEAFVQPSKEPVPSEKPQYRKLEEGMEGEAGSKSWDIWNVFHKAGYMILILSLL